MHKNSVPRLRFQGFAGEWERKTLGELGHCVSGVGFPESEQGGVNGIPFFKVSDMNLSDNEVILKKANHYVTEVQIAKRKWQPIEQLPCIFFAKVGAALLLNRKRLVYQHFLLDNNTMAFIMNNGLNDYFIKTLFDTIELPELAQTGALPSINAKDVENVSVLIPPPPEEQTALGDFFRRLDETLAQARARLAKTQQLKRAMLAKLFPAHGETAPKLRFQGFSGDWERRALGEVAELYQPKTITGSDLTDSGYPVFGANGYIGFYNEANHFEDQVTISARGEGTGTPNYVIAPVWITGNSMVVNIDNNRGINKYFLHSLLSASSLKTYVTGGAQPQLTREVLTNVPLLFPTLEEQTAIGNFFQKLDQTLALQTAELEKLTRLKKALLAAMLV